jgi:uncharacterized membrane protein
MIERVFAAPRYERLDALRGLAVAWMAVFHFCFDLSHFGLIHQDFYRDPFWKLQRACIVTIFMFCAGLSLAVALQQGQSWRRFGKRWAQIAACALLVSIGSYAMFPRSFISFGVLHGFAVMLVLARLTAGAGRWLWLMGLIALVLPNLGGHAFFDNRWLNGIGLVTHKPVTEDYAPVLPWLGVVWWGVASGQLLLASRCDGLAGGIPALIKPLAALGRWSLTFYMLHQPVLIGGLLLWAWAAGAPVAL